MRWSPDAPSDKPLSANEVAKHLLLRDLMGQLPPITTTTMAASTSSRANRTHELWDSFEWQRSLTDSQNGSKRHNAQKCVPQRLLGSLEATLQALPSDTRSQQFAQALPMVHRLPTFLTLLERLTAHTIIANGCTDKCFPPLLPFSYLAAYVAPRASILAPMLVFEDNRRVGDRIYRGIAEIALRLLTQVPPTSIPTAVVR